jgi:hypothetical protein
LSPGTYSFYSVSSLGMSLTIPLLLETRFQLAYEMQRNPCRAHLGKLTVIPLMRTYWWRSQRPATHSTPLSILGFLRKGTFYPCEWWSIVHFLELAGARLLVIQFDKTSLNQYRIPIDHKAYYFHRLDHRRCTSYRR